MLPWLISVTAFLCVLWYWKNKHNTPPGPIGLPFLGYMPFLDTGYLPKSIDKLRQRYGPLFSLKLGSWSTVVIADYDLIKQAFQMRTVTNRPPFIIFDDLSRGGHGLISSSGRLWDEHRRFSMKHLRDLGMGKSSMEEHMIQEAQAMSEVFLAKAGKPLDLSFDLNISMTNTVWALVAGKRMKYDDPFFLGLMKNLDFIVTTISQMGVLGFLPGLAKYLPNSLIGRDTLKNTVLNLEAYVEKVIKEHENTLNPENIRDYIDYFLVAMQKQTKPDTTFTYTQLIVSIRDLFAAGGETTTLTLRWTILILSKFPKVQEKLHQELDEIVGRERAPCLDDRSKMPYTDAVLHEVQRFADIAPFGVFHYTSADVELGGFTIPQGTLIIPFLRRVHRDPKYWSKPDEFYPEHFLNEKGEFTLPTAGFMPFLVGKRQCIGDNVARMGLFLFLTNFLQQFQFDLAPESANVSLEGQPGGLAGIPFPYKVVIRPH